MREEHWKPCPLCYSGDVKKRYVKKEYQSFYECMEDKHRDQGNLVCQECGCEGRLHLWQARGEPEAIPAHPLIKVEDQLDLAAEDIDKALYRAQQEEIELPPEFTEFLDNARGRIRSAGESLRVISRPGRKRLY